MQVTTPPSGCSLQSRNAALCDGRAVFIAQSCIRAGAFAACVERIL